MNYVALLRRINAGGNRRVPMAELRELFASLGFTDVSTYVNSGNVIFSSTTTPNQTVVENAIENKFGFTVDTLILSADEFLSIANAVPSEWQNDYTDHKSDVCFLFADVDSPDVIDRIAPKSDIETIHYIPGAVLSNVTRQNQPKSSLKRLIGTPLYARMTMRNITTVRKLAELIGT